jgi:hypothetical protein
MGAFRITLRTLHEELGNIVGVRTGLTWDESKLEPFIHEVAPDLLNGAHSTRMHASKYSNLFWSILQASGDPWTSMGPVPRWSIMEKIGARRYAVAADLLHSEMHLQKLGNALFSHRHGEGCHKLSEIESYSPAMLVAMNDMFISGGNLRGLDEQLFLGRAHACNGEQVHNDCIEMLRAYRSDQHANPWSSVHHGAADNML